MDIDAYFETDSYFETKGSGEPIVFIHGSYATTATWKKIIEPLAANHWCISIKLPGHCGMPDPTDFADPTIQTELDIIESVISKLTDRAVHLVGHSYGGVVALALALKDSSALSKLTLFEPVAVWVLKAAKDEAMVDRVEQFLKKYRHDASLNLPYTCGEVIDFWGNGCYFESFPVEIKNDMTLLLKNNLRHWNICTRANDTLAALRNISCPTQLIGGSESNPVAHAILDHLHAEIPGSEKSIIAGATHFLVTSHATECVNLLQNNSKN